MNDSRYVKHKRKIPDAMRHRDEIKQETEQVCKIGKKGEGLNLLNIYNRMAYTFLSPVDLSPFSLFTVLEWSIVPRAYDVLGGNKNVKGLPRITSATTMITRRCARFVKFNRI